MNKSKIHFQSSILPAKGVGITIAISGGVDSIALAYFLSQGKRPLQLFHFNHKLRPQNDEMEDSVREFARHFNLPLKVANSHDYPFGKSTSLEAAAREARLKAMEELNLGYTVVCHHLNDAIESYIMRCMLGVMSMKNYYCIPPKTQMTNICLVRPFLLTKKDTLMEYATRHHLMEFVVEDETNKDTDIRRNMVRHQLLPLMETEWNGLEKVVAKHVKADYARFH